MRRAVDAMSSSAIGRAGSSEANVPWMPAVAIPKARASVANSLPSRTAARATSQPSTAPVRNSCATARCPRARPSGRRLSGQSATMWPTARGTAFDPASASTAESSTSGLAPSCSVRKILAITGSPELAAASKTIEVFDCSVVSMRETSSSATQPVSAAERTASTVIPSPRPSPAVRSMLMRLAV